MGYLLGLARIYHLLLIHVNARSWTAPGGWLVGFVCHPERSEGSAFSLLATKPVAFSCKVYRNRRSRDFRLRFFHG
jgi:hypothetical protein